MSKQQLENVIKQLVSEQFRRLRDRTAESVPHSDEDELSDYFSSDLDLPSGSSQSKKSPEEMRSFLDIMMTEDALADDCDKEDE